MSFGTTKPDVAKVRAALAKAVLNGVQRTDDGGAWSQGLLRVDGATPANVRSFVRYLVENKYATTRKIAAGRTPIGGGWRAHTKVELNDRGRMALTDELGLFVTDEPAT